MTNRKTNTLIFHLLALFSGVLMNPAIAATGRGFQPPLDTARDRLFDEGWLFHRGDAPGAEAADCGDAAWRKVSLPHDWSVEPIPEIAAGTSLAPMAGEWRYAKGDDKAYAAAGFDDNAWQTMVLPALVPGCLPASYYWFRRVVELPSGLAGQDVTFDLGRIDDCDEFYVNGQKIGDTGVMPKNQPQGNCVSAWNQNRSYTVPAKFLKPGINLLAICMYNHDGPGGFMPPEATKRETVGPFDSGAISGTAGGYTVGGTGWYRKGFKISADDAGKHVEILFGGIYRYLSDAW